MYTHSRQLLIIIIRNSVVLSKVTQLHGVMVSMLASSVVDHGLEFQSGQTKDYEIGICCFPPNMQH